MGFLKRSRNFKIITKMEKNGCFYFKCAHAAKCRIDEEGGDFVQGAGSNTAKRTSEGKAKRTKRNLPKGQNNKMAQIKSWAIEHTPLTGNGEQNGGGEGSEPGSWVGPGRARAADASVPDVPVGRQEGGRWEAFDKVVVWCACYFYQCRAFRKHNLMEPWGGGGKLTEKWLCPARVVLLFSSK